MIKYLTASLLIAYRIIFWASVILHLRLQSDTHVLNSDKMDFSTNDAFALNSAAAQRNFVVTGHCVSIKPVFPPKYHMKCCRIKSLTHLDATKLSIHKHKQRPPPHPAVLCPSSIMTTQASPPPLCTTVCLLKWITFLDKQRLPLYRTEMAQESLANRARGETDKWCTYKHFWVILRVRGERPRLTLEPFITGCGGAFLSLWIWRDSWDGDMGNCLFADLRFSQLREISGTT